MTIVSCPRCDEPVQIPAGASSRARVRCPLCREQFQLAQVLEGLPPALEVLEDPGEEPEFAAVPLEPAGLPVGMAGDAEPEPADTSSAPAFEIDRSPSRAPRSAATAGSRRHHHRTPTRAQRKPKSAGWEIAKVVLGGVAGLLIAQLLLWWMPWQNLRRDPFDLGPTVAQYAPWLVPATFRGGQAASGGGAGAASEDRQAGDASPFSGDLPQRTFEQPGGGADLMLPVEQSSPRWRSDLGGGGMGAGSDSAAPQSEPADSTARDELPSNRGNTAPGLDANLLDLGMALPDELPEETDPELPLLPVEAEETDPIAESDPTADSAPPAESDATGEEMVADDATGEPPAVADARAPAAVQGESDNTAGAAAPRIGAAELQAALGEARQAAADWHAASPQETRAQLASSFRAFAKLAEAVSWVREPVQEDRLAGMQLLESLGDDADKLQNLGRAGAAWLGAGGRRDSSGILLVGNVAETARQGNLYRTELNLPDGTTAAVYSDADPAAVYGADDLVLIAGAIIEDPQQALPGYQGDEQTVVWGTLARVIPD